MDALNPFMQPKRLIIKIGSALLVDQNGKLRQSWLRALAADIDDLRKSGIQTIIVSSGAIALGCGRLGLNRSNLTLPQKQACAAAGQSLLTRAYETELARHNMRTAQILLTLQDTENRRRWLNARATVNALLDLNVVPIINENDTVATDEIRYGDNDRLAARAAQMISADTLVLLSDIDGLYSSDPRSDENARHFPLVERLTAEIMTMGGESNAITGLGSGGMTTKLAAAQIATQAGCYMCIMDGQADAPLTRLQNGAKNTWFKATQNPRDARRQWIAGHLDAKGNIQIDPGAAQALMDGKSLLAAGVTKVTGSFEKGDTIKITGEDGAELAQGITSYSSSEAQKIIGKRSSDITAVLGFDNGAALIHRDNLVMSQ